MHDIDQAALEQSGTDEFEAAEFGAGEFGAGEFEAAEFEAAEFEAGSGGGLEDAQDPPGPTAGEASELDEAAEIELATTLLEVSGERELEQFVGDVLRTAVGGVADFARSREGRHIGGLLKQAATRVLPGLGADGRARSPVGPAEVARRCFGLELEGISPEDQEFELSRRFVRFADAAARECLRRAGTGPAAQVARAALSTAGRALAPGLVAGRAVGAAPLPRWSDATAANRGQARRPGRPGDCPTCGAARAAGGRWEKRGNTILLFGR